MEIGNEWIDQDLNNSGLTRNDIDIVPLTSEDQLWKHLGRTDFNSQSVIERGGYFIQYPNDNSYLRLKLKSPIGKVKYIAPYGKGNRLYIPKQTIDDVYNYNPDNPLYITEGEKKSASGSKYGYPTIGLSGVYGFLDSDGQIEDFKSLNLNSRNVYIVFDNDIRNKTQVRQAELRLAAHIINKGGISLSIRLPQSCEKVGLDDFLVKHGCDEFQKLVDQAKDTFEIHIEQGTNPEIILKELAKVEKPIFKAQTIKKLATHLNISVKEINKQMEGYTIKESSKSTPHITNYTDNEIGVGIGKLKSHSVLDDMVSLLRESGIVGECENLKILILCYISRLFDKSLHPIIHGQSSSGKSHIANKVLNFIPQSDVIKTSFLTPKALAHYGDDIDHKILLIQEQEGANDSDYSIRTAISEGEIVILITEKNENTGRFETVKKCVSAKGLVTVITTTRDRVHFENETRVIDLYSDESEKQTKRIINSLAQDVDEDIVNEQFRYWQAGISKLKKIDVVIPYKSILAEEFVTSKIRSRRDFSKLLLLIQSYTLLNQFNREINSDGKLVSTVQDFEEVYHIANMALSQSYSEKSKNQEKVLGVILGSFTNGDFSAHQVSNHEDVKKLNLAFRTIERHLNGFCKDGYLTHNGERGRNSKYSVTVTDSLMSPCRLSLFKIHNLPELLEKLENYQRQTQMSLNVADVVNADKNDSISVNDNKRQNQLSLIDEKLLRKDNKLEGEWLINDITTKDIGGVSVPEYLR